MNVGHAADVAWQGNTVHTGSGSTPWTGRRWCAGSTSTATARATWRGTAARCGPCSSTSSQSYEHWEQHFGRDDLGYGQFGENLTVDGLPDDEVCIGDQYRIGEAEFEVTQPRVTCYRVGMRLGEPELPALLVSAPPARLLHAGASREGHMQAGDEIVKTRTGPGAVSVADTDALLYLPHKDLAKLRLALEIPALSPGWQESFRELLAELSPGTRPGQRRGRRRAGPAPAWPGFRPLRVTKVAPESETVSSIYSTSLGQPSPGGAGRAST